MRRTSSSGRWCTVLPREDTVPDSSHGGKKRCTEICKWSSRLWVGLWERVRACQLLDSENGHRGGSLHLVRHVRCQLLGVGPYGKPSGGSYQGHIYKRAPGTADRRREESLDIAVSLGITRGWHMWLHGLSGTAILLSRRSSSNNSHMHASTG